MFENTPGTLKSFATKFTTFVSGMKAKLTFNFLDEEHQLRSMFFAFVERFFIQKSFSSFTERNMDQVDFKKLTENYRGLVNFAKGLREKNKDAKSVFG